MRALFARVMVLLPIGAGMLETNEPNSRATIELETGQQVYGFLCEPYALRQARDISGLGGWRAYLASTARA